MSYKFLIAVASILSIQPAIAEPTEMRCRNSMLENFDNLTKTTCPDNERRGYPGGPVCPDLMLVMRRFVPTAKIPDMATYRMMWAELLVEICVHFPENNNTLKPGEK